MQYLVTGYNLRKDIYHEYKQIMSYHELQVMLRDLEKRQTGTEPKTFLISRIEPVQQ